MRQQHMQQQTRYVEGLLSEAHSATQKFGWGFADLVLDTSGLSAGMLGVVSARGVLPDATPFSFEAGGGAPASLDVSDLDAGTVIYLCLPNRTGGRLLQQYGQADASETLTRFHSHTVDVVDNAATHAGISGDQNDATPNKPKSTPLLLGQLSMQLMPDSADCREFVRLPIARMSATASGSGVHLDPDFIAPVTDIQASARILQYLKELTGVISSRADELAGAVGDLVSGSEFSPNVLWLMLANRYDSLLSIIGSTSIHPAEFYRSLVELVGESATFGPSRRPSEVPEYNHANFTECLIPVVDVLLQTWSRPVDMVVKDLPLKFIRDQNMWAWLIRDHNILTSSSFVLAANADLTEDELAARLPELMLVAPVEEIDEHVAGFQLAVAKIKPRGVPVLNRWTYFHLEPKRKSWADLSESRALAFFVDHLDHDFASLKLKLWAVPQDR